MSGQLPTLAVFDFDGTLIEGDSLPAFLFFSSGATRFIAAFIEALIVASCSRTVGSDFRSVVKERLILRLLGGRKPASLQPAVKRLQRWVRWRDDLRAKLFAHHAQGHQIVIASGALDLYLPALLDGVPHHAVICTTLAQRNGRITGALPQGNCVRQRKAELLQAYIAAHGPFIQSFGYGNAPHDLPMLELVKYRMVV